MYYVRVYCTAPNKLKLVIAIDNKLKHERYCNESNTRMWNYNVPYR